VAARIREVQAAVVARLRDLLPNETIEPSYGLTVDVPEPANRIVYVLPAAFSQVEVADRGRDVTDYVVAVMVLAKAVGLTPAVLTPWADGQIDFVASQVYGPLQDAREDAAYLDGGSLIPQGAEVRSLFNPDDLLAGLFVAELSFTFREYA
jgi:ABC-type Fe3+-hydroxamate transport system substrate-binding protein